MHKQNPTPPPLSAGIRTLFFLYFYQRSWERRATGQPILVTVQYLRQWALLSVAPRPHTHARAPSVNSYRLRTIVKKTKTKSSTSFGLLNDHPPLYVICVRPGLRAVVVLLGLLLGVGLDQDEHKPDREHDPSEDKQRDGLRILLSVVGGRADGGRAAAEAEADERGA